MPTDFHTWGCPVFILDAPNQSGSIGTPKWSPKSHTGIYLGHSPCHAGSVALVLNLKTGLVSPQFHVVYDDDFATVPYLSSTDPPSFWTRLVATSTEQSIEGEQRLTYQWLHPDSNHKSMPIACDDEADRTPNTIERRKAVTWREPSVDTTDVSAPPSTSNISSIPEEHTNSIKTNSTLNNQDTPKPRPSTNIPTSSRSAGEREPGHITSLDLDNIGLRRSPRIQMLNTRRRNLGLLATVMLAASNLITTVPTAAATCFQARVVEYHDFLDRNFDGTSTNLNPLAHIYQSTMANNETYTMKEMMQQPDKHKFMEAMHDEVQSMFREGIWETVPKSVMRQYYRNKREAGLDIKRHQIMMIWSFKRKRRPDGTLVKHKARLCCHGGQQQWGINYWDTYAPVVSWSSIRILLIMANMHNLYTKPIDFIQAYPQAEIKTNIFLHSPPGAELTANNGETVLRLKRNLYGLKDAGRTWHEHLTDGLTAMGFAATESDPCIFTRGSDILILYVDDCVIVSRNKRDADNIFNDLAKRGFKLTDEGSLEEYLGISIKRNKDSFTISQPHLIDRIIASVPGMESARSAKSPAATGSPLTKDEQGEKRKDDWNYRSVVGMLNYLVSCTQPDLAFSVHQCARFCSDPKKSHEQAIERVLRYLQFLRRTNSLGIVYKPDSSKSINTYVDASFAGEWNTEWSGEPSSVISRTGYVVCYADCPVIWSSKLQTEIALSTTEAEYIALSQSLRDVLPLMGLLRELQQAIPFDPKTPVIHCTIHEDNQGCIDLVETPRMQPRTKHIALKYHHFRKHVKDGTISVTYLETTRQIADIFTKALGDSQFGVLRSLLTGW